MSRRSKDDGLDYLRWLEKMWNTHKLDLCYPNTEREEKRKEEILAMFRGFSELSKRRMEAPHFPPWEPPC